ncbi:MAG: purine-nucleoside phosphorylase [Ignavibacteria bacterium]
MRKIKNLNIAVILGSGLDKVASGFSRKKVLPLDKIGVHNKKISIAEFKGFKVLFFIGRKHYYEGSSYEGIVSIIRFAKKLGVKNIIITNAAGSLNENFNESELMLIESHVNFNQKFIHKKNYNHYDLNLKNIFVRICNDLNILCHQGTYCCLPGPAYETKSEVKVLRKFGFDAVGMSTVPEVMESNYLGINVLAVSVITNILKENTAYITDHKKILLTANKTSKTLLKVIQELIIQLN